MKRLAIGLSALLSVAAIVGLSPSAVGGLDAPSTVEDGPVITQASSASGSTDANCRDTRVTVSTGGGEFVPAYAVTPAPGTWNTAVPWITADPGVPFAGTPCGIARFDGLTPEEERLPAAPIVYRYRASLDAFPDGAINRFIDVKLLVDNIATVYIDGVPIGTTATAQPCDTNGDGIVAPIDCPLLAFKGEPMAFRASSPSLNAAGPHLLEIEVVDYRAFTGLSFTTSLGYQIAAAVPDCTASAASSCSLTATASPAGGDRARYCYAPPDGEARDVFIPTTATPGGPMVQITMEPNTWVDAPKPAGGVLYYPNLDWALKYTEIQDRKLSRCPGAIASPPTA